MTPQALDRGFQWKSASLTDEEIFIARDVEDVCELFRALTRLYVPVPWDESANAPDGEDSRVRNFLDLLEVPSPAIRIQVARHAGTFVNAGPASNAGEYLAQAFLREQSARVASAQLEALAPFARRDHAVMKRACYWLGRTQLDEFPKGVNGSYVSSQLYRAAARVMLNSNSISAVGKQGIELLLGHAQDPFLPLCAAWLLEKSKNPFDPHAIEAAKKHLKGHDTYVERCVKLYLARFAEGRARLLEHVETADDFDACYTLQLIADRIDAKDRTPATIESLERLKQRASVMELAQIALGKLDI